jgi:hypothetical protein
VTVRDPVDPACFWVRWDRWTYHPASANMIAETISTLPPQQVNPYGRHFAMMTASDLLLVRRVSRLLLAASQPRLIRAFSHTDRSTTRAKSSKAANQIVNTTTLPHSSSTRPSTLHDPTLKPYATRTPHTARHFPRSVRAAFARSTHGQLIPAHRHHRRHPGRNLPFYTQDSAVFHNDIALYASNGGVVLTSHESSRIVHALGGNKAVVLQNHGILTVGGSVESAIAWFIACVAAPRVFPLCLSVHFLTRSNPGAINPSRTQPRE